MRRNLLTYPYTATSTSVAVNGVTWTINEDGSIILNGTSTATVNIFFRPVNAFMLPTGKYRMSNGNPNAKGYMLIGAEKSEWTGQIIGNTEFEKTVYGTVGYCLYQIPKGNTFNNITIYPSLECIMTTAEMLVEVAKGTQKVYEDGKKSQYDEFWDNFQQNGNRNRYPYGFTSGGWTAQTLKPKYLVKPVDATYASQYAVNMFFRANEESTEHLDFSKIADKFDFSEVINASSLFNSAKFTNVTADLSKAEYASLAFANQWYGCVKSLTLKVSEKLTTATNIFYGNAWLNELTMMEGSVIACEGWDLHWATSLSKASITSVINALSTSTSGKTITFSKTAKNNAFTDSEWSALIATKTNWTISLV
jgi:hypothetical protein